MRTVVARLRSELPVRGRAWVASVLLVGLFAGVVLAAAAGARRTETAYPRLLAAARASDVFVSPYERRLRGSYEEIRSLPQVAEAGLAAVPIMARVDSSGTGDFLVFATTSADGRFGYTINRPKVLEGRLPRPDQATEAMVDPNTARKLALSVGQDLTLRAFDEEPADRAHIGPGDGRPATFRIVGIGVFPDQVVPTQFLDELPRLFLTPAAHRLYAVVPSSIVYEQIFVRLKPRADVDAFRAEVDRIMADDPDARGHDFGFDSDRTAKVQRAIRPQAAALALFAVLAGIAGLFIVGQTLSRQILLDSTEYPTLTALGMSRRQLIAMTVIRVAVIGLAGGLLGAVLAVASSPTMPIGPARLAEPSPGVSVNVALLVTGVGCLVVLLLGVTAWPIWKAASSPAGMLATSEMPGADRASWLAAAVARVGAPASAVAGVRLAVEPGHGRSAVPVRTTLVGTVVALLAGAGAVTFGTNLDRLVSTPSRYGQSWDASLEGGYSLLPTEAVVARLMSDPAVADFSGGNFGEVSIAGKQIPAVGIDARRGGVFPTLLEGRPPAAPDEIVLGTNVLRRINRSVGERIEVEVGGMGREMWIVGRAVFPTLGLPGFSATGLGEGAAVGDSVLPPASSDPRYGPGDIYNFFLVRFHPNAADDGVRRLEADTRRPDGPFGPPCQTNTDGPCLFTIQRPGDIANYARVRATPVALASLLLLLGGTSLAHGLVTSVERRRRDLAILRALGFLGRQVSAAVVWQATTVAVLATLIGLPLGVATGRSAWVLFADRLGVDPDPFVPLASLLVGALSVLVAANFIALLPAHAARRTSPAAALRSE